MVFGYDHHTDKVYRVFDLERKIVERIANVTIDDVMNTNEQVLFPLMFEQQEEASTELLRQEDSLEQMKMTSGIRGVGNKCSAPMY